MRFFRLVLFSAAVAWSSLSFAEQPTVVIVHGFMASSSEHAAWKSGITSQLVNNDFPVYIADTKRIATLEEHAKTLDTLIEENIEPGKPIILLGHSQGGLVSRLYAFNNTNREIVSVVTLGTPHQGVPTTNGIGPSEITFLAASSEMSEANMKLFNETVLDVPDIRYASVATVTNYFAPWVLGLRTSHYQLNRAGYSPNDGVVPVSSAKWGESILDENGEHFKADHISQMMNLPHGFVWNLPAFEIGNAIAEHLLEDAADAGFMECEKLFR